MDQAMSKLHKFTPEVIDFAQKYGGDFLTNTDLLEIKQSLYHLGKAIYLYHFQKAKRHLCPTE